MRDTWLAYRSRGAGFSTSSVAVRCPFDQASLPLLHAPVGFTATFTPSLIATWLFAPYDSWTSPTLFDRRHFDFTTTPSFILHVLQAQPYLQQKTLTTNKASCDHSETLCILRPHRNHKAYSLRLSVSQVQLRIKTLVARPSARIPDAALQNTA